MSNSFGASENQERSPSDIARDTSHTQYSAGADLELGASYQRGRGREEPSSWRGGTIRRRTGASIPTATDTSQTTSVWQLSERSESGADETPERAASCKPSAISPNVQLSAATCRRPASSGGGGSLSGGRTVSASGTTSNTQRLSSIEILNENKQRQLQLEQQESFRQHLEERQRLIQQQGRDGTGDLAYSAYQVEPSEADYARMAAAANAARKQANSAARSAGSWRQTGSASASVNPFDEDPPYPSGRSPAASDQNEPTTVSGRSGFLASLMGEPTETTSGAPADGATTTSANKQKMFDESGEELDSSSGEASGSRLHESTRYSKVAKSASRSYDYDGSQQDQRPFYSKDLPTLLAECRGSRKLVILIVAVALLLDNMLLTAVVPIIPAYLYKLRVYRERHGELSAAVANKSSTGRFGPLDTNRDGRVDEAEIEAELERRVNESLANVADRFSGSFFHPRVLKPRDKFGNFIFEDNDDDNNRDDRQVSRRGDDNDDDDGDDDDDDSGGNNKLADVDMSRSDDQRSSRRQNQRKNRFPRAEMSDGAAPRRPKYDMNDEYEANDDDDNDDTNEDSNGNQDPDDKLNGKIDREKKVAPVKSAPQKQANKSQSDATRNASSKSEGKGERESNQRTGPGSSDGDDDNEDDEDAAAAKKWNKLKSSIDHTAQTIGNDTEVLAYLCLAHALGRKDNSDQRGRSDKDAQQEASSRARERSAARNGHDGSVDDDQRQPDGRKDRARGRNEDRPREKWPVRARPDKKPKVDRLKLNVLPAAKNSETTNEKPDASKGDTGVTKIGDDDVIINHQDIVDESFEVGVMFASKPIVQAIANPFVGAITNRVGFTLPMFLGFTIMFLSTLVFAFGETYATLFLARAIQGVGSACTSVAGMSMIADRFPDDAERGNAMAVALGGLALGVVLGPPFGGFMYEFFGKPSPFIVLAILALLDGLLQLLVLQPRVTKCQDEGASLMTLIKDPYILVAAGAITFANTGIGILEPALPLWMMDTMQAKNWEQGVAFLPAALSYLFSTNLFGNLGLRIGRWRSAMLGLVIIGCSLLLIPFASRVDHLILPNGAIGFAIGMVDSTMMPMLGYLVDIRHTSVYGSVYAIGDVAFCASFVFGPALSGTLVELIGFEGLIITTALLCFAFAPLLVLLRDPPPRQVNEAQMQEQSTLRYVNYSHLEAPVKELK